MEKIKKCFLIIFFLFFSFTLKAGEFPIKINDISGLSTPWPLIASIPFPEGELTDSSNIRILSGEKEVPSQIDVTATWRDGSIRWALAGFTASPQGNYRVEFGEGIKRGKYPNPLKVAKQPNGGFEINTGVAIYRFDKNQLLPDEGWLIAGKEKRQILKNSGAGVYLIDNANREARVSGEASEITNTFLKEGPNRLAVKRSGWYVTTSGKKLARADIWLYFTAGVPYVKITHTLIFTEDTNKVWFKDYGLEFKTPEQPKETYFALGKPETDAQISRIINNGDETYILQADYPHFAERDYKATLGRSDNGKDTIVAELQTVGDWGYGDYGNYGITLVMPWLAERFPKEISFGKKGAKTVFWSGRSGKELDFRISSLIKDYWQNWAPGFPTPNESILSRPSNAQGGSRTHDIWFLPVPDTYKEEKVKKLALASTKQVLVLATPEWVCSTEAFGCPMLHKDTKNFPAEENLLSEYWQRMILPLKAFPMNGFMAWGCFPSRSYHEAKGKPYAALNTIESLRDYGLRREPWRLYARSGERTYYDLGHCFSRFTGDWYVAHCDAPEKRMGNFINSRSYGGKYPKLPVFWGDYTSVNINAGVIDNWLFEYYLTGDEKSLDIVYKIKEAFVETKWTIQPTDTSIKTFITLSMLDWDENAIQTAKNIAYSIIDLKSQNGLKGGGYGALYKDHRTSFALAEYYLQTGDELVKEAILKLIDQRYRFDRRYRPAGHKNHDLFMHSLGYWLTGEESHKRVVEQTLRDLLHYTSLNPLKEQLKQKPENPLEWSNLYIFPIFPGPRTTFHLGQHEFHNPFIGIPTALKFLDKEGWSGKTTPILVKPMSNPVGKILFSHKKGEKTKMSLYLETEEKEIKLNIFPYPENKQSRPVAGIKTDIEEMMPFGKYFLSRPEKYPVTDKKYHIYLEIPSETTSGLYLLSFSEKDTFTLLEISSDKAGLYCPDGFWSICVGDHSGSEFGRAGEGRPAFFYVPENLKELEIFLGRSVRLRAPDGSIVVDWSNKNIGELVVPTEGRGGMWSVEFYTTSVQGRSTPFFVKLLNVEPIVTFGSPDFFPENTTGKPIKVASVASPSSKTDLQFSEGITGKAVKLSGAQTLKFSKGEPVNSGGYTYFPFEKGTIEFWFKPDWTTWEIPMEMTQIIDIPFLTSSHIKLFHRYWNLLNFTNIYGMLRVEVLEQEKNRVAAGFQGRHFFKTGEWAHISYTWDIKESDKNMEGEMNIFINGKKLLTKNAPYRINQVKGTTFFKLADDKNKEIVLGPFNGNMDLLRISDRVVYTEDFEPSKKYGLDKNTRVFFNFDNNLKGVSAFTKEPVVGKK
ncbi:LamG domain-containing protein [bacterium]|nr:LamG domain-containing protein [bacterium]